MQAIAIPTSPPRSNVPIGSFITAALLLGVTGAAFALSQSQLLAGGIYAVGFLLLTWQRPSMALILIMATVPFQIDVSGGADVKFSLAEISLALSMPMWLLGPRRPRSRAKAYALGASLLAYFGISVFASLLHWRGSQTPLSIAQMWLYMVVAVGVFSDLVRRPEQYVPCLVAYLGVCVVLALATLFVREGYVWGMHKNGVGASLATAVIIGVELWLTRSIPISKIFVGFATGISAIGLTLSLSRGAWLAAFVGVGIVLAMRGEFRVMARAGVALIPVFVFAWMLLPPEKREAAFDFDKSRENINARYQSIEIARGYFRSSPIVGVGVGLRKEFDATNVLWIALAETGILGAIAFLSIQGSLALMLVRLRRCVSSSDPRYTFAILGGALAFGRLAHGMFDHYWSRGALMAAWAAVGMLVRVYGETYISPGARRPQVRP